MKMHSTGRMVAVGAVLAIAIAHNAGAQAMKYSLATGLEYTSGQYGGTANIDELYVPLTASMNNGRVGFRLTVPFLSVTAPTGTTSTGENGEIIVGDGAEVTDSGLGDIVGSVTLYDLVSNYDTGFAMDLSATVKFGTADDSVGLGTGKNDYSLRVDAYKFYDRVAWYGAAGYKLRGDPAGVDLDDVLFGSFGGAYRTAAATTIGFYYDFRQSAIAGSDDIHELSGYVAVAVGDNWDLQIYGFTGFTDSSPDWGGGLMLATDFRQFASREPR